jgi:pilus assembly protein Flp/PilA
MKKFLFDEESGQGMVEYGLIIALIAVGCIAAFRTLGGKISSKATDVGSELDRATVPIGTD